MQVTLLDSLRERLRGRLRQRGAAVALALLIEALIAILFLTMVTGLKPKEKPKLVVFGVEDKGDDAAEPTRTDKAKSKPRSGGSTKSVTSPRDPVIPTPPVPPEAQQTSNILWLSRRDYASTDIADKQGSAQAPGQGNGDSDAPDSALAGGRGPHGEPLYAAEWYREPTSRELDPYIPERSRGRGGWGVIACRTVANYRVEDCQELDDSPRGSGYAGAVRQAAWQFRVRPPRVGGKPLIGTWVRILIRYSVTVVHGDSARPGPEGDSEKPDDQ
jgi:protein TonB